ncbi:hypothetical protein M5689_015379 [Euphorbia peplus]|nr:hypothetical protein M5689_015379 [Euphorbia peplus]
MVTTPNSPNQTSGGTRTGPFGSVSNPRPRARRVFYCTRCKKTFEADPQTQTFVETTFPPEYGIPPVDSDDEEEEEDHHHDFPRIEPLPIPCFFSHTGYHLGPYTPLSEFQCLLGGRGCFGHNHNHNGAIPDDQDVNIVDSDDDTATITTTAAEDGSGGDTSGDDDDGGEMRVKDLNLKI